MIIPISAELVSLRTLLSGVRNGVVVLPDFQRDFDWSPQAVRSLLTTVLLGWPPGSLLLAHLSDEHLSDLNPRPFETVASMSNKPSLVVLDGQQRITSLLMALDARGDYRYALSWDVASSEATRDDIENAVVAMPRDRWQSQFASVDQQWRKRIVPFSVLGSPNEFFRWRADIGRHVTADEHTVEILSDLFGSFLSRIAEYQYAATFVSPSVHPKTLAGIFEVTNRSGLRLNTFDLMVARTSSRDWSLREAWDEARDSDSRLARWLGDDATSVLQAIALLQPKRDLRQSAILDLGTEQIASTWIEAVEAVGSAIGFLETECGVAQPELLPYGVMLPALSALFAERQVDAAVLRRWILSAGLGLTYDVASNTRIVADYESLRLGKNPIDAVPLRYLLTATRKGQSAIWRTFLCIISMSGGLEKLRQHPQPLGDYGIRLTPKSIFGPQYSWECQPGPHLRVLSYLLLQQGAAGQRDRERLLADPAGREAQLVPEHMPSAYDSPSAYEEFFDARLQLVAQFLLDQGIEVDWGQSDEG